MSKHLTYTKAHELFEYEPVSGVLVWRAPTTNRVKAGDVAGYDNGAGHLSVGAVGKKHLVHRIAFLLMTGSWPENEVDHVNGIGFDNRWVNLRPATHLENGWNQKARTNNKSGVRGVSWCKRDRKWLAQITCDGVHYYLGLHTDLEIANAHYAGASAILFGQWQRGETKS